MNKIALNKEEKKILQSLISKSPAKRTSQDVKKILSLGAKDFSNRFGETIKKLATE